MKRINLENDLHIHTVASGHAFATLNEIVTYAESKRMKTVGISDHGPSMLGAPVESYFSMKNDVNLCSKKTRILFGCEANILSDAGSLDICEDTIHSLDYVLAGLHNLTPYCSNGELYNTNAIVNCIIKNSILGITHPVNDSFPIEIKPIIEAAQYKRTLLELNSRELIRCSEQTIKNTLTMIELCAETNIPIILSSDSHILNNVGIFSAPQEIFDAISESSVTIINNAFEKLVI